MAGDVTVGALQRLSYMPGLPNKDGGQLIAGQDYFNVFFTGGTISNVTLTNVSITGFTITAPLILGTQAFTDTGTLAQFTGNANSYEQFILQNTNAGNAASADFIVCANNATANTHYGDFGINSSAFAGAGSLNLANATYLYANGGDLVLGIASVTAASIHLVVNNSTSDAMIITAAAQVGINTATPQAGVALDLSGNTLANNSSIVLPKGSTATRPTTGIEGMMRYNTDLFKVEAFFGGAWVSLGSGGGGGTPGGAPNSIQYNNAGSFGGFAMSGDATVVVSTGVITVTQSAGAFNAVGAFSVATNKFTVAAATGNTAVAGTLGVTSDFSINTNKFTITAASGNTIIAGTLGVTSDFSINTNKFIVTAASGNTSIAGTLAVTSTMTSAAHVITSASANSLAVGPNGSTTPIFNVDSSTTNAVAGVNIKGDVTAGNPTISATDSGANTNLTLTSKGSGTLSITAGTSGALNLSSGTANSGVNIQVGGSTRISIGATSGFNITLAPGTMGFASQNHFNFTCPSGDNNLGSVETQIAVWNFSQTRSHSGSYALQRDFEITGATDSMNVAAQTITDAATFAVLYKNAGTNCTYTNCHAILVQTQVITGTVTNAYGLNVSAPTGASNNFAALFTGNVTIASGTLVASATTQAAGNNSTSLATTAYVDRGASGASMVLLGSAAASGAASVTFGSSVLTSTYDDYEIVCDSILPGTGGVALQMIFSANNGVTPITANYDYAGFAAGTGGSGANQASAQASIDLLGGQTIATTATQPTNGTIKIQNINTTTGFVSVITDWSLSNGGTSFGRTVEAGRYSGAAGAINWVQIKTSAGTISGNFYLYGKRKV